MIYPKEGIKLHFLLVTLLRKAIKVRFIKFAAMIINYLIEATSLSHLSRATGFKTASTNTHQLGWVINQILFSVMIFRFQ